MKEKVMDSILIFLMVTIFSMVTMGFRFPVAEASQVQGEGTNQVQGEGTKIPPEALMTVPPGIKNRKAPVPFPHAKHKEMDCTVCHHNAYEILLMSKCSAKGCHFNTKQREGVESYFAAFHNVFEQSDRSCIDCHKTRGKGPTACKDCHRLKIHRP